MEDISNELSLAATRVGVLDEAQRVSISSIAAARLLLHHTSIQTAFQP
jgi:hypothetical protein